MAAGSTTLHAVEKLQVRLATKTDPKKLEKYLQKLSALPMTADILAETGIRKTVKRLRKHQHVGDFARDLAARWKKLVLVDPNTGPDAQDPEESASRKHFGEALQDQEKACGFPENGTAPGAHRTVLSTDGQHTEHLWRSRDLTEGLPVASPEPRESAPEGPQLIQAPIGLLHCTRLPSRCPRALSPLCPRSNLEEATLTPLRAGLCWVRATRANPRGKGLKSQKQTPHQRSRRKPLWLDTE
uniref:TFIIS N-terminal domain-containing protein n=1 Tax=Piliocolobus tephrosceles TaxID=591936 RepID=A0A8C9HEH8_9PRIM